MNSILIIFFLIGLSVLVSRIDAKGENSRLIEINSTLFSRKTESLEDKQIDELINEIRNIIGDSERVGNVPKRLISFMNWIDGNDCSLTELGKRKDYGKTLIKNHPYFANLVLKLEAKKNNQCRSEVDQLFRDKLRSLKEDCENGRGNCIDEMNEFKNVIRDSLKEKGLQERQLMKLSYIDLAPAVVAYLRRYMGLGLNKTAREKWSDHKRRFEPVARAILRYSCKTNLYSFPKEITKPVKILLSDSYGNKKDGFSQETIDWMETLHICLTLGTKIHKAYVLNTLNIDDLYKTFVLMRSDRDRKPVDDWVRLRRSFEDLLQIIKTLNEFEDDLQETDLRISTEPLGSILNSGQCSDCSIGCFARIVDLVMTHKEYINIQTFLKGSFASRYEKCFMNLGKSFEHAYSQVMKEADLQKDSEMGSRLDTLLSLVSEVAQGQRVEQMYLTNLMPEVVISFSRKSDNLPMNDSKTIDEKVKQIMSSFEDKFGGACRKLQELNLIEPLLSLKNLMKADPERLHNLLGNSQDKIDWLYKARVCDIILKKQIKIHVIKRRMKSIN